MHTSTCSSSSASILKFLLRAITYVNIAMRRHCTRQQRAQFHATQMLRNDVPLILVQLAILIILAGYLDNVDAPLFDVIEYFAGMEAISGAMRRAGWRAFGYDFVKGGHCDILSVQGFIFAIMLALCTRDGGMAWFAPKCSSWIWLCRSLTGRFAGNALGRQWVHQVCKRAQLGQLTMSTCFA